MTQAPLMVWTDLQGWSTFGEQFVSIIVTALIICVICLIYNTRIRAHDRRPNERLGGFLVLVEMLITYTEQLVVDALGKKYRKLTPYALYIMMYIFIGSVFSLIGVESLTTSYTVPLCMAIVTLAAVYYFGFKYQKWSYFKRYKNPLEIITQFTPLISLSFRLFGNLLGGSIILGLVYALFIGLQSDFAGNGNQVGAIYGQLPGVDGNSSWAQSWQYQYTYFWSGFNIFTTFLTPWMHMYFDLFDAGIQAIVFTMLTLSYWQEAMGEEESEGKEPERRGSELNQIENKKAEKTAKEAKTVQVAM